jgi:hypothetical protein
MLTYCPHAADTDLARMKLLARGITMGIDHIIIVDDWDTAADALEYGETNEICLVSIAEYLTKLTTLVNRARLVERE